MHQTGQESGAQSTSAELGVVFVCDKLEEETGAVLDNSLETELCTGPAETKPGEEEDLSILLRGAADIVTGIPQTAWQGKGCKHNPNLQTGNIKAPPESRSPTSAQGRFLHCCRLGCFPFFLCKRDSCMSILPLPGRMCRWWLGIGGGGWGGGGRGAKLGS